MSALSMYPHSTSMRKYLGEIVRQVNAKTGRRTLDHEDDTYVKPTMTQSSALDEMYGDDLAKMTLHITQHGYLTPLRTEDYPTIFQENTSTKPIDYVFHDAGSARTILPLFVGRHEVWVGHDTDRAAHTTELDFKNQL